MAFIGDTFFLAFAVSAFSQLGDKSACNILQWFCPDLPVALLRIWPQICVLENYLMLSPNLFPMTYHLSMTIWNSHQDMTNMSNNNNNNDQNISVMPNKRTCPTTTTTMIKIFL